MSRQVEVIGKMEFPSGFVFGDMEEPAQEVWLEELYRINELVRQYVLKFIDDTDIGCLPSYCGAEYIEVQGDHPEMTLNWQTNTDVVYVECEDDDFKGAIQFWPEIIDNKCMYVFKDERFE